MYKQCNSHEREILELSAEHLGMTIPEMLTYQQIEDDPNAHKNKKTLEHFTLKIIRTIGNRGKQTVQDIKFMAAVNGNQKGDGFPVYGVVELINSIKAGFSLVEQAEK